MALANIQKETVAYMGMQFQETKSKKMRKQLHMSLISKEKRNATQKIEADPFVISLGGGKKKKPLLSGFDGLIEVLRRDCNTWVQSLVHSGPVYMTVLEVLCSRNFIENETTNFLIYIYIYTYFDPTPPLYKQS